MLILTRKKDEAIFIGNNIKIIVVEIKSGCTQVKIGIEAPDNINIRREEVQDNQ